MQMRCTSPRTVGYRSDGKTISWSPKNYSKEFATFQLPCGKCIDCRLEYSRNWAVRCVHESMVHQDNCFLTLTYSDDHIGDNRLKYDDFQLFLKKLRFHVWCESIKKLGFTDDQFRDLSLKEKVAFRKEYKEYLDSKLINFFVTGEYGEKENRMHWHALLFNYSPTDLVYKYSNDLGDKVYKSQFLDDLWGKGFVDVGSVTFDSAAYVARYAAKKLSHGHDGTHRFEPISKKSTKIAIGRRFLEKYWKDIFSYGECRLENGQTVPIPRYYVKWLEKHHPEAWVEYVSKIKVDALEEFKKVIERENKRIKEVNQNRAPFSGPQITKEEHRKKITNQLMKRLAGYSKF